MSFQASGTVKCWKKYDCLGCGAVYRHRFSRSVTGGGMTAQHAEANAQRAGMKALLNKVDPCPCPECGRVQPRMVGHTKLWEHKVVTSITFGVLAFVTVLGATSAMGREVAALAAFSVAGLGALAHLWYAGSNPNSNPEANKEHAAGKVDAGEVEVLRPGDTSFGEPAPPLVTRSHLVYFALGLGAAALALVPVAVRVANGWALGPTDPPVFGPGDTFRVTFPNKIDCVRSTWNGTPKVTFNGNVPGAIVSSNTATWGTSMSIKASETHTSPTLWADITLPDDPHLSNSEVSGRVEMTVSYPQANGPRGMSDGQTVIETAFRVQLATPYAWQTYRQAWWVGLLACTVLSALAGWGFAGLASRMKWGSPPGLVESIDTPPSDQPHEAPNRPQSRL
ncbi:hypothetical protein [Frigoriglobus tundricola]|uniref:Uncharacterized protein n=1 Tax=Frigoriglobus tundricola TaxID=2774151 RepID=A0A6M5YN15_9BACT|nr:hypothetical protein [Frigoriglobus tundricola]QJW95318.1 hypothetical protein FTUN_2865 [Frigoriglobus tundricola]